MPPLTLDRFTALLAEYVAKRFAITITAVRTAAESAISASPQDTAIFFFRKTLDLFCARIGKEPFLNI